MDDFYFVYFSHSRLLSLPDHGRSHVGHSLVCRHAHAQGRALFALLDVSRQLDGNACTSLPIGKHRFLFIAIESEICSLCPPRGLDPVQIVWL